MRGLLERVKFLFWMGALAAVALLFGILFFIITFRRSILLGSIVVVLIIALL